MTRRIPAALLLAAPAALAAARGSLPMQGGTVALSVAVETAEGEPLGGLAPGDFEVLLDGKPQPILAVEPGPHALRLALLIDVTIRPPLSGAQVRRSVEAFARALTPADAAQVWSLGGRLSKESTWTADGRTLLEMARPVIDPPPAALGGPSPIWDAVMDAVGALSAGADPKAVVLISDGRATANRHGLAETIEAASRANVTVSAIAPAPEPGPVMMPSGGFILPRQTATPSRATVLELLTANTGGRLFEYEPGRPAAVPDLVTRIVNGLRQEYRLAIARPAGDAPKLIEVRVARPNLTLRARRIL